MKEQLFHFVNAMFHLIDEGYTPNGHQYDWANDFLREHNYELQFKDQNDYVCQFGQYDMLCSVFEKGI